MLTDDQYIHHLPYLALIRMRYVDERDVLLLASCKAPSPNAVDASASRLRQAGLGRRRPDGPLGPLVAAGDPGGRGLAVATDRSGAQPPRPVPAAAALAMDAIRAAASAVGSRTATRALEGWRLRPSRGHVDRRHPA